MFRELEILNGLIVDAKVSSVTRNGDTEGKQFARSWIIRRGFAFQDIMPILAASRV